MCVDVWVGEEPRLCAGCTCLEQPTDLGSRIQDFLTHHLSSRHTIHTSASHHTGHTSTRVTQVTPPPQPTSHPTSEWHACPPSPPLFPVAELRWDVAARVAASALKLKFCQNAEALLHGDLHTGG